MRDKINSARNFVSRHKTQMLTAGLLVTTSVALAQHAGIKELNQFLKDNDLFDKYYALEDDEN